MEAPEQNKHGVQHVNAQSVVLA